MSVAELVADIAPSEDACATQFEQQLKIELTDKSLEKILSNLSSVDGWYEAWRWIFWQRLKLPNDKTTLTDSQSCAVSFLLANTKTLVVFLTSGGCADWASALNIFGEILTVDDSCAFLDWKLQLALGTALCFADGQTDPSMHNEEPIDYLSRYLGFCFAVESGQLLEDALLMMAWHWRYVVSSWHADSCLEWARENVQAELRCLRKIGNAARMVRYRDKNDAGVSVHEGLRFYDDQKSTMAIIHKYGGVCGAVSKFGTSACQAFGVPAMPVAQPGHCAMIWRSAGGKWVLENDNSGWSQSTMHAEIQRTWDELGCDSAGIIAIMEEAQRLKEKYHISESFRLVAPVATPHRSSLLIEAVSVCPYNLPAWADLLKHSSKVDAKATTSAAEVRTELLEKLSKLSGVSSSVIIDVARCRPVQASDDCGHAVNLVDGSGSKWSPTSTDDQWIELDLQCSCKVEEVRVQWWGDYGNKSGLVLQSGGADREFLFQGIREHDAGFNGWSVFPGWVEPARIIRLDLSNPQPDCFGTGKQYGLRQVQVLGRYSEAACELQSPMELVYRWAEFLFASNEIADIQALRFVRHYVETLKIQESLACSILKPLRPSKWPILGRTDLWLTVGAPTLRRSSGQYYYELELGTDIADPQIGWVTDLFDVKSSSSGEGVGDDEHGWAADGQRHLKWHCQQYEAKWPAVWSEGDTIGCAIDIDVGDMNFSYNGTWVPAASFHFEAGQRVFYPAASLRGQFRFIFADAAFQFAPPSEGYLPLLSAKEATESIPDGGHLIGVTVVPGVFRYPP